MESRPPHDADEISARMAAVRGDVDRGLEHVAASARRLADWRFYLRQFPILIPAAAVAIGYFVVPRRRRRGVVAALRAVQGRSATKTDANETSAATSGIATTMLGMVGTIAARAVAAYLGRQLQTMLERRHAQGSPSNE